MIKATLIRILSILNGEVALPQPNPVTNITPYSSDSLDTLLKKWESATLYQKGLLVFPDYFPFLDINGEITMNGVTLQKRMLTFAGLDDAQNPRWTSNGLPPTVTETNQYILSYYVNRLRLEYYNPITQTVDARWETGLQNTDLFSTTLLPTYQSGVEVTITAHLT